MSCSDNTATGIRLAAAGAVGFETAGDEPDFDTDGV
jgi:hypothetical protein